MRNLSRLAAIGAATAMLSACVAYPAGPGYGGPAYGQAPYPAPSGPVVATDSGRIVNIEYLPVGAVYRQAPNPMGAVVGGIAGALIGNQFGSGGARAASTVLGGVAGASVGHAIAYNNAGVVTQPGYRITMRSDQGYVRTYEVPATGDLRIGDRVRIDNGMIYRS
ncbi:glycine zipper 2TM domain-containing protein [Ramlibacter sp. PS3R-8]|uniref:glycine zipper 2TM domain-containing protein n=1 Tax=Ramlibacter sp. PS3R-8 TaxID=3133437 RepID=UPI0030ADF4AA